jgi:hypothetical protein
MPTTAPADEQLRGRVPRRERLPRPARQVDLLVRHHAGQHRRHQDVEDRAHSSETMIPIGFVLPVRL